MLAVEVGTGYGTCMDGRGSYHRKHRKTYNTPHHAHLLAFSCYRRQPFFSGDRAPQWFLKCLDKARSELAFGLWAFVVMPEHVHLLIAPGEEYEISRILWKIKRPVTYLAVQHVKAACPSFLNRIAHRQSSGKVTHRFWQRGGGFDQNLWTSRRIHAAARYIHRNPVR